MARCQQCNQFASYEDGYEPEVDDLELDAESGTVVGNIRVVLVSACCGDEMKEGNFEVSHELGEDFIEFMKKLPEDFSKEDIEVEFDGQAEMTSRTQTTDRRGKPIRNPRYMKTFYGYDYSGTVKVHADVDGKEFDASFDLNFSDDMQASWFEELY